ncbi:DNA-binding transcriptional LysR family regulator [Clostridium moniliforme]|uniref:DNA-binding transcriptional LysR family regulator n=1 Tax=Clostridium moniliforme TaxID=39489 RepID=A0ABS4EZ10_9CLOT|nr:LysR family transcriptional regulator [Clostridium moniliforme]MBP1889082.1 DNA-binding transcriptional LysR family regulator [Clostridium moniliforme]
MNIETLKTFLILAENNNFTKTSEALFCTQAAVSLRIKNLESYYGAKLFSRDNKDVKLTEAGKELLPYAKKIIDISNEAKLKISLLNDLKEQKIHLLCSSTPGTYILPEIIYKFNQKFPYISILNDVKYTKDVIENIKNNTSSFALISQPEFFDTEDLTCEAIGEDPVVLFVGKNHPWKDRKSIGIAELKNSKFLISNPKTSIIKYIENLGNFKFNKENIFTIGNIEAIKQGVISNIGVSVLSYHSIKNEVNYGLVKIIPFKENIEMNRKIYLIKNKDYKYSTSEEVFIDFLKDSLRKL